MAKQFFYNERKGSQKGPFSLDEIHLLAARGALKPKTLIFNTEGEAFDADEVVDFKAVQATTTTGSAANRSATAFWIPLSIRLVATIFLFVLSIYWLQQSNSISRDASEVGHFQLSAQYSMLALIAFGFAVVTWFISRPQNSLY